MTASRPIQCFFPGAFATLAEAVQQAFASRNPDARLVFHPFVPSGQLVAEILGGAPADVVVTANRAFMARLVETGFVKQPAVLAGNRLCIIVRPELRGRIRTLGDLAQPGLRVVAPQAQTDPCGQYVEQFFTRSGLAEAMQAKAQAGTLLRSRGSADLPAFLLQGRADAGLLYASEAHALGTAVAVITLPPAFDLHEAIVFMVGAVWREGQVHPLADALIAFLCGPRGQELLRNAGFQPRDAVIAMGAA